MTDGIHRNSGLCTKVRHIPVPVQGPRNAANRAEAVRLRHHEAEHVQLSDPEMADRPVAMSVDEMVSAGTPEKMTEPEPSGLIVATALPWLRTPEEPPGAAGERGHDVGCLVGARTVVVDDGSGDCRPHVRAGRQREGGTGSGHLPRGCQSPQRPRRRQTDRRCAR